MPVFLGVGVGVGVGFGTGCTGAQGFGVSLQPAFYAASCPAGVVFRSLAGAVPEVALQMAWRRDCLPVVANFAVAARRVVER